jgi:inosine/xanthosine triphosphate pyrophosphatase family protein
MKIVTSNINKLKEFKRILPDIESVSGKDLREVQGTPEEVVIYKAIDAGKDLIVEDTILIIDGEEIVDIKWKIQELKNLKSVDTIKATWQVMLGYNNGSHIEIYKGIVNGIIIPDSKEEGFGFDPYFLPDGSDVVLSVLEKEGNKDKFSARRNALVNLKMGRDEVVHQISDIPKWNGSYQND